MSKIENREKVKQFDYVVALEKENKKFEEAKKEKTIKKVVPKVLSTKEVVIMPKKTVNLTQQEMQLKGEALLNRLKDSVNFEGLDLKFKVTNSWYCGYKLGNKCVFCVKYSPKDILKVEVIISKQQFTELGIKGNYFDNRYADYLYNEEEFEKFSKIVQIAVDNFKAKLPKVQSKKKEEVKKEEISKAKTRKGPAPVSVVTRGKKYI